MTDQPIIRRLAPDHPVARRLHAIRDARDVQRLDRVAYTILANVENGPWQLITDPALRAVVREYVADACHSIAAEAGLNEAMEAAHDALPTRLAVDGRLTTCQTEAQRLRDELAAIRDLAYRVGHGDAARDALEAIHQRATRALTEGNRP